MFSLSVSPDFRKLPPRIEDRVAVIYAEPARVPRALPIPAVKPATRPVFGRRSVGK